MELWSPLLFLEFDALYLRPLRRSEEKEGKALRVPWPFSELACEWSFNL